MTKEQVGALISGGRLPPGMKKPALVETHISWVLIDGEYVYKIKKPVHYSFLDFSTLEKRKFYCEREIVLNNRFTEGIYLDVVTITESDGQVVLDGKMGEIIEYAVKMRKLDRSRQMDQLLLNNKVTVTDIRNLAARIASFHKGARIIKHVNVQDIADKFSDLASQADFLEDHLPGSKEIITNAIQVSTDFLQKKKEVFERRLRLGFFRDCHGDLHSRNIFLLPEPTPFDCLEFNDEFRYMDVLDEAAFLCMDLDAFGRKDLADLFITAYEDFNHSLETEDDRQMFIYYKAYRANIRAKVNSLRAGGFNNEAERRMPLRDASKYLQLMNGYVQNIRVKV